MSEQMSKKRSPTTVTDELEQERDQPYPTTIKSDFDSTACVANTSPSQSQNQNTNGRKRPKFDSTNSQLNIESATLQVNGSSETSQSTHTSDTQDAAPVDVVMMDSNSSIIASPPFVPHGILKLPQSIASALASDHLNKLEIRDLGVTCHWMLVSLRDCWIKEPISLSSAIQRLNRQQLNRGSKAPNDSFCGGGGVRIPNLFVGRFRNINYCLRQSIVTETEVKLLTDIHRLVDCRKFTLHLSDICSGDIKEKFQWHRPAVVLPNRLQELHVSNFGNLISIGDFVLPSSLVRIEFGPHQNHTLGCLSKLKLPAESRLKAMVGMFIDSSVKRPVSLPNGISTLVFQRPITNPITKVNLPNSIRSLEIPLWQDQNGRYRDLPFPSALKRLVLTVTMGKEDFDLTQWVHLPLSCKNLELTFSTELTAQLFYLEVADQPSSPIVIPPHVEQLRISRLVHSTRWKLPPLNLSNATSLKTLVTDSLQEIEWPDGSSDALKSLKLKTSGREFLAGIPSSLTLLELSSADSYVGSDVYQLFPTLFPSLTHLVVPIHYNRDEFFSSMIALGTALPRCRITGYSVLPTTASSNDVFYGYYQYLNGVQVAFNCLTRSALHRRQQRDQDRFDSKPIEVE